MSGRRSEPSRETLFIENIMVPAHRARGLDEAAISRLMESISKIGLQTPVSVRADGDDLVLVAGRHRLEAARRLGWDRIDAVHMNGNEQDARLWEISENLHRAELTEAERREHIAEWVRIVEARVVHGGPPSGGPQPTEKGIRKAARELGISHQAVKRAVDAESLPDDAKAEADALGLGTVARAKLAKTADPVAEMQRLKAEREADDARRLNRERDRILEERHIANISEWLAARLDVTEMQELGAMLRGVCDPLAKTLLREAA